MPTTVRLTPEREHRLDELATRWGCNRSEVFGKFLDGSLNLNGSSNEEVVGLIEEVTYRPYAELPIARRYKLVAAWKGLIGTTQHDFARGTILTRDGHPPELIGALYARGAKLVALPD